MIELRLFGVLSLKRDGVELNSLLAQPKRVALLAYMCASTPYGFHRRDSLIALFWPDSDESHARASLRNALHNLRRALGESAIQVRGDEEVSVNPQVVWCDARAFTEHVEANRNEEALALYTGHLLPGFYIEEAPEFERWLSGQRSRLRGFAAAAARRVADIFSQQNRIADAVSAATRGLELSGFEENDVRRLMELHSRSGNPGAAVKMFDTYASRVSNELGAQPSEELRRVANDLRQGRSESSHGIRPHDAKDTAPIPDITHPAERALMPAKAGGRTRILRGVVASTIVILGALALVANERRTKLTNGSHMTRRKLTSRSSTLMGSLSPDGQFLAYVIQDGDSQRVVLHDVADGGERIAKSLGGVIWSLEWSKVGSQIMIGGSPRPILISRIDTATRIVGPKLAGQVMAYWLPDSVRISLHTTGDRFVTVLDLRSQESKSLPVPGSYTWLDEGDWSATGRVFALMTQSNDPLSWEIRTVDFNGHNDILVKDTVPLGSPRWSPDGRLLYYARDGNTIWRLKTDPKTAKARSNPEQILDDLQMYPQKFGLAHFSLSSDGHSLVYARGQRFSNLWLLTDEATQQSIRTALTRGTSLLWSPSVSPDGSLIAFAEETDRGGELFTIPTTGGDARRVTNGARVHRENQIAWSPDGKRIAFTSVRRGVAQVWTADVASGELTLMGGNASTTTGHLTWSPGRRIAYQRAHNENIGLIDPTTRIETSLSADTVWQVMHSPRYSPDGSLIAVFWNIGREPKYPPPGIYVFDPDRGTHYRVGRGLYPRGWSPDGRSIFYQRPQSPIVYRVPAVDGNDTAQVVLNPAFREAQCFPVGPSRPHTFVCAAFDFTSDIWRVDSIDR